MYHETRIIDGWLWFRNHPNRPFEKATAEQYVNHLRQELAEAKRMLAEAMKS